MCIKFTTWFLLTNLVIGIALARSGMLGDDIDNELPPLKQSGGIQRKPEIGVINNEDVEKGIALECTLTGETGPGSKNEQPKVVTDTKWKWVRFEISDNEEEIEIPLEGQVSSKLDPEELKATAKELSGWSRLKCSYGDKFAEFHVDAGNITKEPSLPFRLEICINSQFEDCQYKKSINVVEKEDISIFCQVVNKTGGKEGIKEMKEQLNVRWYQWNVTEDQSYIPKETDKPTKPNCTRYFPCIICDKYIDGEN